MPTLPENLGLNIWNANQVSPQNPTNKGWGIALSLFKVGVAVGTTTPPGSPVEGDWHIVGQGATGDWSTFQADSIAVYHNGGWTELQADSLDGFALRVDDGSGGSDVYQYEGVGSPSGWTQLVGGSGSSAYDIAVNFSATPSSSERLARYVIPRAITLPANFSGSSGASLDTNPEFQFDIDVQDDAATIGTVSISSAGAFTFSTSGGVAKSIAAGSVLEFVAPGGSPTETSIAGINFTIQGSVD